MLRHRFAAGFARGYDLFVRMHILPKLRGRDGVLQGRCPNCGGELLRRPIQPAAKLAKYPASRERIFKPEGCAGRVARP
jgi:hypothetical protein